MLSLFAFFMGLAHAQSNDTCVTESVRFAQCVESCSNQKTCTDPKDVFAGVCASQAQAYLKCGDIAKDAAANRFVRSRLAAAKATTTDAGPSAIE
jgi:hypothetical protein